MVLNKLNAVKYIHETILRYSRENSFPWVEKWERGVKLDIF
jgi:hypothetical protein